MWFMLGCAEQNPSDRNCLWYFHFGSVDVRAKYKMEKRSHYSNALHFDRPNYLLVNFRIQFEIITSFSAIFTIVLVHILHIGNCAAKFNESIWCTKGNEGIEIKLTATEFHLNMQLLFLNIDLNGIKRENSHRFLSMNVRRSAEHISFDFVNKNRTRNESICFFLSPFTTAIHSQPILISSNLLKMQIHLFTHLVFFVSFSFCYRT